MHYVWVRRAASCEIHNIVFQICTPTSTEPTEPSLLINMAELTAAKNRHKGYLSAVTTKIMKLEQCIMVE